MNQKENNKYAFLSRLSTGALEEIICADIDLEDGVGDELVMCVLDVLAERSGTPEERRAKTEKSWFKLQKRLKEGGPVRYDSSPRGSKEF
jgi:hypothetical protein